MSKRSADIPGYWTIRELAAAASLTEATVRYHCREGKLRGMARYTGREWLVPEVAGEAFIAWAEERRAGR